MMKAYKCVKGAGLLETMIALLLGAIILAEIFRYSYFLEKSVHYAASKIESIEKNNVLFAWVVNDIEMAGYFGCVNATSRESIIDDTGMLNRDWLVVAQNYLSSEYMSTEHFLVVEKSADNEVIVDGNNNFKAEDIIVLENCFGAQVLKTKKIRSINHDEKTGLQFYSSIKLTNLQHLYVAKLVFHEYWVDDEKAHALRVNDIKNNNNIILENIRDFKVEKKNNNFNISVIDEENNALISLSAKAKNAS